MNFLARGALFYGSILAGGLSFGYSVPRPEWANSLARTGARGAGATAATVLATNAATSPSLTTPSARESAESAELRALRLAEADLFPDIPPSPLGTKERAEFDAPLDRDSLSLERGIRDEKETGDWLAGLSMPDLPVKDDPRVRQYVRYFTRTNHGRKIFRTWLARSGRYRSLVATALREHAMPSDLQALVFIESGYSPTAVSSAGAAGLWQMMPDTARIYGLTVEHDYDERRSVTRATDAAVRHLSDLYSHFGTWDLALAAYDMGYRGLVDRVRDMATNDYWTMSTVNGGLPREAVLYVPKVLAVSLILRNLSHFGFDTTKVDSPTFTADLEVPAHASLAKIARAAGTSLQKIHQLNPEILSETVPDRGDVCKVHIPSSGLARAEELLPRLLERSRRTDADDQVGDDFDWGRDELPRRTSVNGYDEDRRADGDFDPLYAPRPPRYHARPFFSSGDNDDDVGNGRALVFYRVGDNESLVSIARALGANPEEIVADNDLDPQAKLQRGMLLKVHAAPSAMSRITKKRASSRLQTQDANDADALAYEDSPTRAKVAGGPSSHTSHTADSHLPLAPKQKLQDD